MTGKQQQRLYNEQQRLAAQPRAERAYKLKQAGETWATIGRILGVSWQRAQQIAARYKPNGEKSGRPR